jgi:predicted nucleic acid-binding protein
MLGLMRRAFDLRANVTAYDVCYVALGEALDWPLCTVDGRLAHVLSMTSSFLASTA